MQHEIFFQKTARFCIVLATLIWGSAFVVMKNAIDAFPIFYLLAFRFLAAAVLLGCFLLPRWKKVTKDYLWRGAVIGLFLFLAYATQTFGLQDTTPSVNAFLTTIYCVVVPFFNWMVAKTKPDRYHLLAAILSIAGVGFISLNGSQIVFGSGTLLTLLSGCFFAAHIVTLDRSAKERDVFILTAIQFATAGGIAVICGVCFESFPTVWTNDTVLCLGYLTLFCTVATLSLQAIGQKYTEPATTSVLLSLESVFAVVFSMLFYGERPSVLLFCGFGLIFCAVICAETKFQFLRKKFSKTSGGVLAFGEEEKKKGHPAPLK